MNTLDTTDFSILALLQEDASQSIQQIADAVNLSQNACWRRIRQMEEAGVIRKRVALLDAAKVGAGLTVFVQVRAAEHSEDWLENFAAAVKKIPEIVEFYRMTGEVDYLIKMRVADMAGYDRAYKTLIGSARLGDVSASFAMEEIKASTAIPLPQKR
ncbi:MAG: transcriptional regulator [Alphaproteobacteria bacterium]|nr:transcriptional regulator [Alphaproteobacteria bacterium]MDB5739129.1 transcriptional regulator [Alphaproteobacteria bacterium]